MLPDPHDDELIEQLLQAEDASAAPAENETLVNMRGDLETLKAQLREPAPVDPYSDEPDCRAAVDRISALASSSAERTQIDSMPAIPPAQVPSLGSLGHYRLVEKIGEGGMGAVYKAVHTKLDRIVALKVLPPGRLRDQHAVNRFEREMRAVGKLQHPNIVAAYDAGETGGTHYLVVELIQGRDLASLVQERGPLPIAEACEVVRQAALGLQHAHEHGLVHRDIKPSNLMLAESHAAGAPTVKVLDLGLALLEEGQLDLAGELTSTGQVMGTIDYMAPEQGQDSHTVDIRADVYSLGATLYKLLTGRAPFAGPQYDSTLKKLMALATKVPPPVGELRPDCPPQLAALVHQLLAKQPADRPATPAEVAGALGAFATGADLRRLLSASAASVPPITRGTTTNAFEETQHDSPAKEVATVSSSPSTRPSARHRVLAGLAAAAVLVTVFAVVIVLQTGSGTLEIVADEGVDFEVSVLSKNVALPDGWRIRSGPNERTVRAGAVEIRLPADKQDEFEIISPDELVIRRNDKTVFRVVRKDRGPLVQRTQVAAADSTLGKPVEIAEPPALEDWLKGREALTVAQDGSGQFKTIQSALNALQAGQVVKVLDRGPYRERLDTRDLPEDTGLVSEVDTLIEATDWKPYWTEAETGVVHYAGHYFFYISGFRVSGFTFTFPASGDKVTDGICAERADGFVLERCWLRSGPKLALSAGFRAGRMHRPGCVRECRLDEGVLWNAGTSSGGEVLIGRNYLTGRVQIQLSNGARFDKVAVRKNVCAGLETAVFIGPIDIGACEISNNFMQSDMGILLLESAPHHLTICNNLHPRAGLIAFDRVPRDRIRDAVATWSIGHNCFVRELETPADAQAFYVSKAASDVIGTPRFLSKVPASPGYPRLAANDPIARQGAGGAWPDYIGPLPPGPAPKEGDWFSRQRARWHDSSATPAPEAPVADLPPPVEIPEPPQLKEWLKDREILTVAQDGSGMFKTIQSALAALKAGQVIQVLDRGPYRERLDANELPRDTGLVSEVDTQIEVPDWKEQWTDPATGRVFYTGHSLFYLNGFRVSGFTFSFPESGDKRTDGLGVDRADGFVLERCWFRRGAFRPAAINFGEGEIQRPGCVRECRFDDGLAWGPGASTGGQLLIARNLFTGQTQLELSSGGSFDSVVVRNNICAGQNIGIHIATTEVGACEISNNFIQSETAIAFLHTAPHHVTICNNLHLGAGLINFNEVEADRMRDALATWQVGHNCFASEPESSQQIIFAPKALSDVLGTPRFLSKVPTSTDYPRVAESDPIARQGAGGKWPEYIGPFPPGPAPAEGDWYSKMRARWKDDASQDSSGTSLTPFTAAALNVPDWPRGARDPGFPGLVPQPTPIAGVHRWQMATRAPRGWLENLAWSPDGKQVVTCGLDQMVRVYDAESKQLVHAWPVEQVRTVNWSADGKLIATAGHDGRIELWSTDDWTRHVKCQAPEGETQIIDSIVFSPDGKRIGTTIQGDPAARLWKTATGEPDGILPHPLGASDIAFSPDGLRAATSCWDSIVRLWDLETGKVSVEFPKQSAPGVAVAFANQGKHLVTTDAAGKVIVWDVERKQQVHAWDGGGMAIAANRQGLVAAVTASDPRILVWDIATGKSAQVLRGHQYQFRQRHGIQFHPTEPVLASVAQEGELRFWNLRTGECTGVIEPRGEDFFRVEFDPSGSTLTGAGLLTQAARLWNVADGSLRFAIKPPNCRYVRWITFSPDGSQFVTCSGDAPSHLLTTGTEDFAVRLWNTSDGSAGPVLTGHTGRVVTAAFTPDGSRIISGGWENNLRVWNRKTGAAERVIPAVIGPGQLVCSPDGKRLAGVGWPNQFQLWDLESWEPIPTPAPPPEDRSVREYVAFHPRLPELAIAEGNRVTIRSTEQGNLLREAVRGRSITVAISPDGKLLASSDDRRIQLYAYDTGAPIGKPLREPFGYCRAVAFSPDSRLLAAGSADGVIRLLDLETSTCLRVWLPLRDKLAATVTAAGQLLMDPAEAEEEIIYLVQREQGSAVEVLKPSEFQKRYGAMLPKPEAN